MTDAWRPLFNSLDCAIAAHRAAKGSFVDDADDTLHARHDLARHRAHRLLSASDDPDEQGDDSEDHKDRDEVGVADGGEHESPPRDAADAERLRDMEAMVDRWLRFLQVIAATVSLFEPDLPPRLSTFIDDLVVTVDHWERGGPRR
jgi:hypothetical protein